MTELTALNYDLFRIGYAGTRYPNSIKAIQFLLNPDLAPIANKPFYIGRSKIIFYGNPNVMMTRSTLVGESGSDILEGQVHFASSNIIYEKEGPSLLWVILYINSMLTDEMVQYSNNDLGARLFNLIELIYILKWCDYFGVSQESVLYTTIRTYVFNNIYNIAYGHTKGNLTLEELSYIEQLYSQYRRKCMMNPKKTVCSRFGYLAQVLQINLYKTDREAWLIAEVYYDELGPTDSHLIILDWLLNPYELTSSMKKAMRTVLNSCHANTLAYSPKILSALAKDVDFHISESTQETMNRYMHHEISRESMLEKFIR